MLDHFPRNGWKISQWLYNCLTDAIFDLSKHFSSTPNHLFFILDVILFFFEVFTTYPLKVGQTQKVLSARSLDFILREYELLFQYILLLGEGNSIKNRENYFHKWNWSKVLVISVDHVFQPKSFLHGGHWFRRVYPWLKIALCRFTRPGIRDWLLNVSSSVR